MGKPFPSFFRYNGIDTPITYFQIHTNYHIADNFQSIKIATGLKDGFLHLFVHEVTLDIHKSQHNYNNTMIIGTTINNIN